MNIKTILHQLGKGIYSSIKRYPVTLFFATTVAALLITMSELKAYISPTTLSTLSRITMAAALGIPLSLCVRAYYERKDFEDLTRLILGYTVGIILQVAYYFFFLKELTMVPTTRFVGVNLALYLCFIFIPYWYNRKDFEIHVINIFTSFLITYVYSGVLFAGLAAILFAVDNLLGIAVKEVMYYYTFLMVALVFAPAYFLTFIPRRDELKDTFHYSRVLKILLLYIVMPLLTVYTLILYLYFGRIIISMEWPSGIVSHLVLWYSLILTMVLFFITPIRLENKWSAIFSKWSPRIILPILIMMFISMGIRISAYGVTENRYYVFILGLWIFAVMIYLSLVRDKKNILLLVSLSVVVMISIFGPLSSYSISKRSQNNRLEKILIENNMLEDGVIKPNSTINNENQQSISSILMYFENTHSLKEIPSLPEDFDITKMESTFGFPYQFSIQPMYEYFYFTMDMESKVFDISGYDQLVDSQGVYRDSPPGEEYNVRLLPNSNVLSVTLHDNEIISEDLSRLIEVLYEKYGSTPKHSSVLDHDLIVENENESYEYKMIIQSIGGQRDSSGDLMINEVNFYLLLSKKS